MNCQKDGEEMELVDSYYSIELEIEEGCPVKIETFVCPKCHFEEQIETWEGHVGEKKK